MSGCPAKVRIVGADEEDAVMGLCRALHAENGVFDLDDDKVRSMLRRAFNEEGGIIAAVGPKDAIEGLIFLLLSSHWYTKSNHWEELFLYVKPEFRSVVNRAEKERSVATELMNFAKWVADSSGFPLIIGVFSDERTESKVRLYQRHFKQARGAYFFYNGSKTAA